VFDLVIRFTQTKKNKKPFVKKKKKKKGTTLSYTTSTRSVTTVAQCRSSPDQPHYVMGSLFYG
jgi:hypothetical protein